MERYLELKGHGRNEPEGVNEAEGMANLTQYFKDLLVGRIGEDRHYHGVKGVISVVPRMITDKGSEGPRIGIVIRGNFNGSDVDSVLCSNEDYVIYSARTVMDGEPILEKKNSSINHELSLDDLLIRRAS